MPKKREDSELTKASQVELWMPSGLQEKKPKRTTIEKVARPPTKAEDQLVETGALIHLDPATSNNAAYMHVVLCHLGMPRSKKKERVFDRVYSRPNFYGAVRMEAGSLWNGRQFVEHPLPYGIKPRLIFLDVLTRISHKGIRSSLSSYDNWRAENNLADLRRTS